MKLTLQDLKDFFKTKKVGSKHQASKTGFKHKHRLSRGELNSLNHSLEKKYKEVK